MARKTACLVFSALLLSSLIAYLPAADVPVKSAWAATPPAIDGSDKDWPGQELIEDTTTGVEYAFRNDDRNLYILFFFKTPQSRSTVDATGVKVYYSVDGKNKKDRGVHFLRKQLSAEDLIKSLEKSEGKLDEERKAEIRKSPGYTVFEADVINKKKTPAPLDPAFPSETPAFRFARKQRAVVYEFRVPLSRTNQPGGISVKPGQAFNIGFEWGGMTKEMIAAQMTKRAEQSTQAAARQTSMESSLTDGDERVDITEGPSGFSPNKMAKKHAFWVALQLAEGR